MRHTAIEDLPELEDLETRHRVAPMDPMIVDRPDINNTERYQKFIRTDSHATPQSGMHAEHFTNQNNLGFHGGYNSEGYGNPGGGTMYATLQPKEMYAPPEQRVMAPPPSQPDPLSYNCIDIARHIENCPICSKFYSNDKTVYVIAIVVLAIVCLLLLKRVLNV